MLHYNIIQDYKQLQSRTDLVLDNTQCVSLGNKKCKKILGNVFAPDAFDKYLPWSASLVQIYFVCIIIWQTWKLPYISKMMLGGEDSTNLS